MKRTSSSLAALALLAAAGAHAQSNVQVYGLLDAGVDTLNNTKAGGGTETRVSSGGMNTSRWGLKGSEDLGGGLKAVFQLEAGIALDTGAADPALFQRQSNVGLEGGFGRVVVGRSFSSTYDTLINFDPMGFAPFYSWATGGNGSGINQNKYGFNTAFDNMIKYSGSVGNFKFGADYGAGEQATGSQDSAKEGMTGVYTAGPLSLVGTWERTNGNTVPATGNRDKNTVWHLGFNYENGPLKLSAVMRDYKTVAGKALTPDIDGTTYWAGVNYKTNPATTLTVVVYYINVKNVAAGTDADPTMYVARYRYALSRRTDLYVAAAYAKARNGQFTGLSRSDAGFGENQHGLMTGIQHRF